MTRKGRRQPKHFRNDQRRFDVPANGSGNDAVMNETMPERFGRSIQTPMQNYIASSKIRPVADYFSATEDARPVTGWRSLPEIPNSAEILTPVRKLSQLAQDDVSNNGTKPADDDDEEEEEAQYRLCLADANNVDGPWLSKKRYLKSQYKLLREDALHSLRKAVESVRFAKHMNEDPDNNNLGIYDEVYITGFNFANSGIAVRVKFSLNRVGRNVKWEQSKRLTTGSLVVLIADDDTAICKVAVIAARPLWMLNGGVEPSQFNEEKSASEDAENDSPEIFLSFANANEMEIDCHRKWIMVEERTGFFEAERYTLLALQRMADESFPLSEYLVNVNKSVAAPTYVVDRPHRDLSEIFGASPDRLEDNVDILGDWPKSSPVNLDKSQLNAIQRILTKRLAVVQGPPGTGKTFVSVQALKIMLRDWQSGDPPIIITCQTNHALDQLLRHVQKVMPDYVRLGGRSKDDEVKTRTLFNLREPAQNRAGDAIKKLKKEMVELLEPLQKGCEILTVEQLAKYGIISDKVVEAFQTHALNWFPEQSKENPIKLWLGNMVEPVDLKQKHLIFDDFEEASFEFEDIKEADAEQLVGDNDAEEILKGTLVTIGDAWDGKSSDDDKWNNAKAEACAMKKIAEWLQKTNFIMTPAAKRGDVYRYLLREYKSRVLSRFREKAASYLTMTKKRRIGLWDTDVAFLKNRNIKIIGVTTTGFSKYRGLLSSLRPKIVIIEEAAETLEGPVAVTCVDSLQHLVLVGDHKQLRPHCHLRDLGEPPWNLNISLFERLVNIGVEFSMLKRQRRMIPHVRRLLHPIYGNEIEDHPSVLDSRPPVAGMGDKSTWFFTHQWPESQDHMRSSFNRREAMMIVRFIQYLFYNGIQPHVITVLTFYNGQRRLLRNLLRELAKMINAPSIETVKVVTVDSYQGEENKIVILSLVRSNHFGSIGFLGVENRVCVALSRAQCGFYIFGDATLLHENNSTWSAVIDIMIGHNQVANRIGWYLPLQCQNHGKVTKIQTPGDWGKNAGGCDIECGYILDCGHQCPNLCHPTDHEYMSCREPCEKKLACGHGCSKKCGSQCQCGKCSEAGNISRRAASSASSPLKQPTASSPLRHSAGSSPDKRPAGSSGLKQPAGSAKRAPAHKPSDESSPMHHPSTRAWNDFANGGMIKHDADLVKERKDEQTTKRLQYLDDENAALLFAADNLTLDDSSKPRVVKLDKGKGKMVWHSTHMEGPLTMNGTGEGTSKAAMPSLLD